MPMFRLNVPYVWIDVKTLSFSVDMAHVKCVATECASVPSVASQSVNAYSSFDDVNVDILDMADEQQYMDYCREFLFC